MKEGTTENRNVRFKEKPLDKTPQMWYNKGGKGQPKASSKSRGMARGSMVETFTGCYFHNYTHTNTKRSIIMKKVIIGIKTITRIHLRHDCDEDIVISTSYNGSVWGSSISVYNKAFDICDDMGSVVYTGDVRDLHPRLPKDRTFDDGDLTEFDYTAVEDRYVGF